MLADLTAVPALVGPSAEHALKANNAHRKIVNSHSVRLSAHDLGCHVPRRARCVLLVLRVPDARNSKICNLEIAVLVKD